MSEMSEMGGSGETGHEDSMDQRKRQASAWAAGVLGRDRVELRPVSGDASFRRYFRIDTAGRSIIVMDAPPHKEDSAPFVDIASRLRQAGLKAPEIVSFDLDLGFGLLEDFGDTLYRELINEQTVDSVFNELISVLAHLAHRVDPYGLPAYDENQLRDELDLFTDWYLGRHKQFQLEGDELDTWSGLCTRLLNSAASQPQVFVHRDFHSCNLLLTADGPGIIDFQDGVRGPISYDLVSLLWDRYLSWPRDRMEGWMEQARRQLMPGCPASDWILYCDWMGLQRNLKIAGIFARLNYRDHKQGYLEMIPRFYQYLLDVLALYPEFRDFQKLLERSECAP
jgi:aminoglycoside/choline kinase family phosphotransferase